MSLPNTELHIAADALPPSDKAVHPFCVHSFGLTDRGQVRPTNQDHFVILEMARTLNVHVTSIHQAKAQYSSQRGHIFLVADGMGGHKAGEVASSLSILTIEGFLLNTLKRFFHFEGPEERKVMREFQSALLRADAKVFEEAAEHPELIGMGTTLTMAFAVDWKLYIAHVGDSRCYLYSKNQLHQLTQDHTVVAELVRLGTISPAEASRHPYRHVITNVVGGHQPGVHAELHKLDLHPGDVLLMCSDGLTGTVDDNRIAAILAEEPEPQAACARLIAKANDQGGKDNITVVVAHFV